MIESWHWTACRITGSLWGISTGLSPFNCCGGCPCNLNKTTRSVYLALLCVHIYIYVYIYVCVCVCACVCSCVCITKLGKFLCLFCYEQRKLVDCVLILSLCISINYLSNIWCEKSRLAGSSCLNAKCTGFVWHTNIIHGYYNSLYRSVNMGLHLQE